MDHMFVIWEGGQAAETADRNAVMADMFVIATEPIHIAERG